MSKKNNKKKNHNSNNKKVLEIKEEATSWSKDFDRLVLYADFLGFKHRIYTKSHEEVHKEMEEFHQSWTRKLGPLKKGEYLREVQFSDSIIVVVNGTSEQMFNLLSKAAIRLMHTAISMGLPIKGVISQGHFTFDEDNELYLGRALVDAYLLEEQVKYYGIVVHNTAEKTIKTYTSKKNPYCNSPINILKGVTCHWHLCWNLVNQYLSYEDITEKCNSWISKIAEDVSGEPRIYIDNTIKILGQDRNKFSDNENVEEETTENEQ